MTLLLSFFAVWNFVVLLILVGRVRKLNNHHHGGFTVGREVEYKD